jgi:hypothetical protein
MVNFQDLRSAGYDDGVDQQTLLVWTPNGTGMSKITSLQHITRASLWLATILNAPFFPIF